MTLLSIVDSTVIAPPNVQSSPGEALPLLEFVQDNRTMIHSLQAAAADIGLGDGHVRTQPLLAASWAT